jgi:lipoic acid synthetase
MLKVEKLNRPDWIRVKSPNSCGFTDTLNVIKTRNVHTICENAMCPNIGECWKNKTATFLIMGNICTRTCKFCNVATGVPKQLDSDEPKNVAQSVQDLGLKYVVITSVTRDDLKDGGAAHFARVIRAIKKLNYKTEVEILTPDFQKNDEAIKIILDAKPTVWGHNLEVVKKLHQNIKRLPSNYATSLDFLKKIKKFSPSIITKTGIMVGIGEEKSDVLEFIKDTAATSVDIVTIGQYLAPSKFHYSIVRYVSPEEFSEYEQYGKTLGSKIVAGPLVRSSYRAKEAYNSLCCT